MKINNRNNSVRKITQSGRKIIGIFPSLKMRKSIWWESMIERDYIYLLEIDPEVKSYKEQPFKINYILNGKKHIYTPDFLVERTDKKQVIEVKPEVKTKSPEFVIFYKCISKVLQKEGYEYMVVTDQKIRIQPKLDNVKLLHKYARISISINNQIDIHNYFSKRNESTLREIETFFISKGVETQILYALIYWGILSTDLSKPINSSSVVTLSTADFLKLKEVKTYGI